MTKYAIPACGFCFLINAEDDMTPDDILKAIKMASVEYCSTPEGIKVYEGNHHHFNYGDFNTYVPNRICKKYGISKDKTKYNCLDLQMDFNGRNERLVDMWY